MHATGSEKSSGERIQNSNYGPCDRSTSSFWKKTQPDRKIRKGWVDSILEIWSFFIMEEGCDPLFILWFN
jgi:hypothetical protein